MQKKRERYEFDINQYTANVTRREATAIPTAFCQQRHRPQVKTRRQFISDCTLSLSALALLPAGVGCLTAAAGPSGHRLSYAVLVAQINTEFHLLLNDGKVAKLTLLRAPLAPPPRLVPGRKPPADLSHEKFSLIFSGPTDRRIASAIHQFDHPELGRFEMHLGPIGAPAEGRRRYEAVFNQPAPAASRRQV